jgi:hypothetical protein
MSKTDRVTVHIAADLREWARANAYNLTALINRLLRQKKDQDEDRG